MPPIYLFNRHPPLARALRNPALSFLFLSALFLCATCPITQAQQTSEGLIASSANLPDAPLPVAFNPQTSSSSQAAPSSPQTPSTQTQVQKEERQRILGIAPNFNVTYSSDVPPLRPKEKLQLAFKSATDPFQFLAAGLDAAYSMGTDGFGPQYTTSTNSAGVKITTRQEGYGQGAVGYLKYFGSSYADNFDGTMIGNALLPILLKEDPRYFRMGKGTVKRRLLYSISTTVWCKRDNGNWGPNYANVIGNLAAGGISNLYYPSFDRGASLTITRGLTVTAEGMIGGVVDEFLPDLTRHFLHRDISGQRVGPAAPVSTAPAPAPDAPK